MAPPNILYLHSHDTGRFVQPYGYAVATPHLQQLAEEGVLFRQAFCAGPTCSPSRAALLTGQSPHAAGMLGLAHRGLPMRDLSHHVVHTLRQAGYHTALAGVQHVAARAEDIGYDQVLGGHEHAEASAVLFLSDPPRQPFFLDVGFFETHRLAHGPFAAEAHPPDGRHVRPPAVLPDTPETRVDWADFMQSARRLDRKMGIVLRALDDCGLAQNTLVVCTTDHGPAFPRMKCNLTDGGTGVMLMLRGPGGFTGGKVVDGLVSHLDVFPTLCDVAGIEPPPWLEGRSLAPLARGEVTTIRDEVFSEVTWHAAPEPVRSVRTARWRYVRRYDDRKGPVLPNCDDSPSKDVMLRLGWRDAVPDREQLYDLAFDAGEAHNLARDPACRAVLDELRGRLDAWMRATRDPLLEGPFVPPAGAQYNDPDGLSPNEPLLTVE